jgi:hypothetical protein
MISKRIPQDVNEVSGTPIIKNHDGVWWIIGHFIF